MLSKNYSRRDFLSLSLGVLVTPTLLSACKKKPIPETVINCDNQNTLSNSEKAIRQNLKYVDQTPIATRRCDNCKLYIIIKESSCGGCKVVPGPIHPAGYCSSWYQMM